MTTKKAPKNSLFARIVLQLTIPLILLGTLLTALQINTQLNALNKTHQIESRWAFTTVDAEIRSKFETAKSEENLVKLAKSFKIKAQNFNVSQISFFNYLKAAPLDSSDTWDSFDLEQSEKAILENDSKGTPYRIAVNRETRQLQAYIPLAHQNDDSIYIARATIILSDFKEAINKSRAYLAIMLFSIIIVGSIIGYNLSKSIIRPIRLLNRATQDIAGGKLGGQVKINTGDEIEVLAQTFNEMSHALEEMKQKAVDANPLTGLPGNQGIFQELKKRIFERQKFVLFHVDLDRFKVFNDHYGLAKGDEAIKKTAELLKLCLTEKGAQDDYVGHQGGDDYVIITRPNRAQGLAQHIVDNFDKTVVGALYTKDEIQQGYTVHEDRRHFTETGQQTTRNFPLLAISLAGISTAKKDLADYFQCMTLAAEMKKEVKKNVKSSFIISEDF